MTYEDLERTVRRWLTENRADTREPGPPHGRLYAVPFALVWDALLEEIRRRSRWELAHADEEIGMLTVRCRSRIFRFVDDMTIWVRLDENGMTRVDIRSRSRVGRGDFGVNRRRVQRLLEHLDREVGEGKRLE